MKKVITSVVSLLLILCILSGCSIDKKNLEELSFLLKNTVYCLVHPYSDFIEEYNDKINPSENNCFSRPEEVNFKRLPLEKRMGYNSLKDNEKEMYKLLEEAADNLDNVVEFKGIKVYHEDFNRVFDCFKTDCPDIFYLYDGFQYINYDLDQYADLFILLYTDGDSYDKLNENWEMEEEASRKTIASQMTSLYNRVDYLQKMMPKDSTEDTIKYIYETVAVDTDYDHDFAEIVDKYNQKVMANALKKEDEEKEEFTNEELMVRYKYQSTSYGALCYRNAICGGYTAAIGLLLNSQGIVNGVCRGRIDMKYYHIWNVVKIDEKYYHLDATNERSLDGNSSAWMLYEYYLCNDAVMRAKYEFLSTIYTAPACSDNSLYIYDKTTCKITDSRDITYEKYREMATEAVKRKTHVVTFISVYPVSTAAINLFYNRYYDHTFNVDGVKPKLSNVYYHSGDYREIHFYISY